MDAAARHSETFSACVATALLAGACAGPPPPVADVHVSSAVAYRELKSKGHTPLAAQDGATLDADWRPPGWPVWLAGGVGLGSDVGSVPLGDARADIAALTFDVSLGAKYYFDLSGCPVRPFVGGGGAWVYSRRTDVGLLGPGLIGTQNEHDDVAGGYLQLGLSWRISDLWTAGVEARVFRGSSFTVFGTESSADFDQLGFFGGVAF